MIDRQKVDISPGRVRRVYLLALVLVIGLFLFHTLLLFEVAESLIQLKTWLAEHLGPHKVGRTIVLTSFVVLFIAHVAEAATYGLFLRWNRLVPSFSEGLYFSSATITALGYRDVVLPPLWITRTPRPSTAHSAASRG